MTELFAITFKDSGKILSPDSYKEYWKNYGSNQLHGWRPPKKVYFKMGQAKSGFAHIPEQMKPLLNISRFVLAENLVDGAELTVEQKENKIRKKIALDKRYQNYQIAQAKRALELAQEKLAKLQ